MIVKQVFDTQTYKLDIPTDVLPKNGVKLAHHFNSTKYDNLIELAGRTCYDSSKLEKTRNSVDYHKHINEVKHGSVQEHANLVISLQPDGYGQLLQYILEIGGNRPGVYWTWHDPFFTINFNVRAANEWGRITNTIGDIGHTIRHYAKISAPLACNFVQIEAPIKYQPVAGKRFISFYIGEVSRGLTHELIRHKYETAVSQRSTRFVNESDSMWSYHPLITTHQQDLGNYLGDVKYLEKFQNSAKYAYDSIVEFLNKKLENIGLSKLAAIKQSRGAARGLLGNALSTELIFTASIEEWRHIILMRGNQHADAEIRLFANKAYEELLATDEQAITSLVVGDTCPDGIGYEILETK